MVSTNGRSAQMQDAAEAARTSEFNSTQQLVNPNYHRSSVLETHQTMIVNGMTEKNTENQIFGLKNQGAADTTNQADMYLRNPSSPGLYKALI